MYLLTTVTAMTTSVGIVETRAVPAASWAYCINDVDWMFSKISRSYGPGMWMSATLIMNTWSVRGLYPPPVIPAGIWSFQIGRASCRERVFALV